MRLGGEMSEDLGSLSAELARFREENARIMGRMEAHIAHLSETIGARETYAAGYRRETREKIERVGRDVLELKGDVTALKDNMEKVEPIVEAFKHYRSKATGIVLALSIGGAIAGWLITQFISEIKTAVLRFFS